VLPPAVRLASSRYPSLIVESNPQRGAESAARLALAITAVLAVAKIVAWVSTSSLAILSQALDSLLDVVALALVLVAVRIAARPADTTHHYGHAKAENVAALVQTIFLGAVVAGVAAEAVRRLLSDGQDVDTPGYAFVLLGGSILVDAVRGVVLGRAARAARSDALQAGALNVATDISTATIALFSLVFTRAGFEDADAIGGLLVAVAVAIAAYRLGRRSVDVLMDRAPGVPVEEIEAAATRARGVAETRRVRVRGTGDKMFADITVAAGRTASLERAHDIAEEVETEIAKVYPGADVVVHVEPISETSGIVERAQAAASRVEGVREVHNVAVHAFEEAGNQWLHVTLHAKVSTETSLGDAHSLSDSVEDSVATELGGRVRVDSHIEPLKPTVPGRDVTHAETELVAAVEAAATEEPDVLDCHEVLVTSSDGALSIVAHVRGRGDLPLARLHDASDRIEKRLHAAYPQIADVVIHFEPA